MTPIPAPDAYEDAIPPYGIRVPKSSAPASLIPQSFARIGSDLSAALAEFGLPPVVGAGPIVANSVAARTAHWGNPLNAAARLALQARGAETIRTDLGWTERYYAALVEGVTNNPGGVAVAGWYPVSGAMPILECANADTNFGLAYATVTPWQPPTQQRGTAVMVAGVFTVPIAGRWAFDYYQPLAAGATTNGGIRLLVNGVAQLALENVATSAEGLRMQLRTEMTLAANATVAAQCRRNTAGSRPADPRRFVASYLGPA